MAGVISGPGGLAKAGAGTLTLALANTYTGATSLSAGTLLVPGRRRRVPTLTTVSGRHADGLRCRGWQGPI